MDYPVFEQEIIALGPLALRWYGLAYLAAFVFAWWLGRRRAARVQPPFDDTAISDLIFYGALGVVLGGRIGYVFFYGFDRLLADPLWALRIWDGGMSFHGGMLGVFVAMALFARSTGRTFFAVTDFVAPLVPVGLGLGRLGNFVNTELPGRITESAFGMRYPCWAVRDLDETCASYWEPVLRHPSPLYQAFAEGVVLFVLMLLFARRPRPPMAVSGMFLLGYGVLRFCTEWFRSPDAGIGFVFGDWLTRGQLLCLPMVAGGIVLLALAYRRGTAGASAPAAR